MVVIKSKKEGNKIVIDGLKKLIDDLETGKIKYDTFSIHYDIIKKVTDYGNIEYEHTGHQTMNIEFIEVKND